MPPSMRSIIERPKTAILPPCPGRKGRTDRPLRPPSSAASPKVIFLLPSKEPSASECTAKTAADDEFCADESCDHRVITFPCPAPIHVYTLQPLSTAASVADETLLPSLSVMRAGASKATEISPLESADIGEYALEDGRLNPVRPSLVRTKASDPVNTPVASPVAEIWAFSGRDASRSLPSAPIPSTYAKSLFPDCITRAFLPSTFVSKTRSSSPSKVIERNKVLSAGLLYA